MDRMGETGLFTLLLNPHVNLQTVSPLLAKKNIPPILNKLEYLITFESPSL
jgi:hypothetical protein